MAVNKELHPRSDVYKMYILRTEGGRESLRCKMYLKTGENSLESYVKYHIEPSKTWSCLMKSNLKGCSKA